jgi:hypothetical protein
VSSASPAPRTTWKRSTTIVASGNCERTAWRASVEDLVHALAIEIGDDRGEFARALAMSRLVEGEAPR